MGHRLRSQRGIGYIAVLVIIALVGFFATLGFKMGPAYFDFLQVRGVMDSLHKDPDLVLRGPRAILEKATSQLRMNNVRYVNKTHFKIERAPDGVKLLVNYEVRKHVAFNADVLMAFDHSVVLNRP
jgi:hypothetical protein